MNETIWVVVGTFLITFAVSLLGLFKFVQAMGEKAIEQAQSLFKQQEERLESSKKELRAQVETVSAIEGKARHDVANNLTSLVGRVEVRLDRLDSDTVRKADFISLEARVTNRLDKIEGKLDRITEVLGELAGMRTQMIAIEKHVTKSAT